jgi:hypothetical protein
MEVPVKVSQTVLMLCQVTTVAPPVRPSSAVARLPQAGVETKVSIACLFIVLLSMEPWAAAKKALS